MQTYGQAGHRKILFMNAFQEYTKHLAVANFKTYGRLDYEAYKKVPLPECFYDHIENNLIPNKTLNSIHNIYMKLL